MIRLYGWASCQSCAFALPLISLAHRENLVISVDVQIYSEKAAYSGIIEEILNEYWGEQWKTYWRERGVPTPTIFVQLKKNSNWRLVRPDITLYVINEISNYLYDNGGDKAVMMYLDSETKLDSFFKSLLMELLSNTLATDANRVPIFKTAVN